MLVAIAAIALLSGCYQKMGRQPSYDPLEPSGFFKDGMSARPRVAGTVARGDISTNPYFDTGMINGQPGDGFPMTVTAALMDRGQDRYNIYCSQCHGRLGDGNGMIPSRGFRRPPSFHTAQLRTQKAGHFFDVMTNGFGAMPPYRTMIPASDRWAIVAYIRALQLAQGATINDVPADKRAQLSGAPAPSPAKSTTTPAGGAH
ncbi:MAG TPA: cytochrome c [Thermoanaerobaculia bacterium]